MGNKTKKQLLEELSEVQKKNRDSRSYDKKISDAYRQ